MSATNEKGEPKELRYEKEGTSATGETPATGDISTAKVEVKGKNLKEGGKKGRGKTTGRNTGVSRADNKNVDDGSYGEKETGKVPAAMKKVLSQARCGFCDNPMADNSEGARVVPVKGKKIPKDEEGQYIYESPGATSGQMVGVLCSTCAKMADDPRYVKPDGNSYVDIKKVLVVRRNGEIANIRVIELDALQS